MAPGTLSLSSFFILFMAAPANGAAPERPNIVLILADDLGYGDLGCFNPASRIPTPNLDRLAKQGMRFTDAHSATVCSPTRYGLLTGRYSWRGPLKTGVVSPWGRPILEPGRMTLPALLQKSGYRTACFGKWHLGWNWPTTDGRAASSGPDALSNVDFHQALGGGPTAHGFEYFFGVDLPNFPPYCFIENDRAVGIPSVRNLPSINRPGPMLPGWKQVDILPELARRATQYIEQAAREPKQSPFFVYLALTSPHYPIVPAPAFHGKSGAGDYGDFVAQTDDVVGQLVGAIEKANLSGKTLIVFTSDNGPEVAFEVGVGAYERIRKYGHDSLGGLRGVKRDLWEGGHRVPFLARWDGHVPEATVRGATISHVDLFATIAALLDQAIPQDAAEDSFSFLPLLLNQPHSPRISTVHHGAQGAFAVRVGDWVYIQSASGGANGKPPRYGEPEWYQQARGYQIDDQPGQLFNLREDLAEKHNRFAEEPGRVAAMKRVLDEARSSRRTAPIRPAGPAHP